MSKVGVNKDSVSTLAAKAATEPTRFNATERSNYIRTNIEQIVRMSRQGRTAEEVKAIFPEFVEQYPSLVEMVLRPGGFDERSLSLMIQMLENMCRGKASQHEASIKVGQHLINSYVKPQLNE